VTPYQTLCALLPINFSWAAVGLAIFLHWAGGLGIRWVSLPYQPPQFSNSQVAGILPGFAGRSCQGRPVEWIGMHRIHHLHSDQRADPIDSNQGFWWSHLVWMLITPAESKFLASLKTLQTTQYISLYKLFCLTPGCPGVLLFLLGGWSFVVWGILSAWWWFTTAQLVNSATISLAIAPMNLVISQLTAGG